MARETIGWATELYNTLTVRWVPGNKGVTGNEIADPYAKKAFQRMQR